MTDWARKARLFFVFSLSEFRLNFPFKWLQIQSWPQSCHSPLWSTLTLVVETQTCWQKHHFRMKMTRATIVFDGNAGGQVGTFWGFLVLWLSAVWVKCKQRQTQNASVLGWWIVISKLICRQVSVVSSEIVASGPRCSLRCSWCQIPNWWMHQHEGWAGLH